MKKKIWLVIPVTCILLVLAVAIILVNRPTPQDKIMDMLNRVENALEDEWEKKTVTEVSDLVYSNGAVRISLFALYRTNTVLIFFLALASANA